MGSKMSDAPDDAQHGTRLLLLWLCWIALAAFLFAAGVVAFH